MSATRLRAARKEVRKPSDLVEERVNALREFEQWGRWPDSHLKGLFVHVGRNKSVWRYLSQKQINGKRTSAFRTIGYFPEMQVAKAREQALIYAGTVAAGTAAPGKRVAMRFGPAFESYLAHLKAQAERRGKPPRWYLNAKKLYEAHIKPEWDSWTLYEMSQNPRAVKAWHAKLSKAIPTSADHCARLIRACYREEARLDRSLPAALPTSGIKFGRVKVSGKVVDFDAFPAWRKAWDKIDSPVKRAYHLTGMLTGCRPGELAMVRQDDVDREKLTLTIRNAKAGQDIVLPITKQILWAIDLATDAKPSPIVQRGLRGMRRGEKRIAYRKKWHADVTDADLLFPGARQAAQRSGLPVAGNALRHTFRSIATALGISEMLVHFLMGHALEGVSAKYTNELMLMRSAELRAAQEKISARIFELLELELLGGSA